MTGFLLSNKTLNKIFQKNIFEHCWDANISRIAIVETPWIQTILEGDGSITTNRGTDTRLHVYLKATNSKQGEFWMENHLKREQQKQQLQNFLES